LLRFEKYIGIDWSGAKTPKSSYSIAVASSTISNESAPEAMTNKQSRTQVYELIVKSIKDSKKTLIGIDCNFGYNSAVAKQQIGENANFQTLWQTVEDANKEHDNFFAGNMWSLPPFNQYFWTSGKQPEWFNAAKLQRQTEKAAAMQSLGIPESPFKLIGAKQVGKGGLAGMRMLYQLKKDYGNKIAVWPFEQDIMNEAVVVISEIYPRLFIKHAGFGNKKIRNIRDLNATLAHFGATAYPEEFALNDHLSDAIIACAGLKWFCEHRVPLDIKLPRDATNIEGWIFGVGC
jgi:hypothetical protein